MRRRKVLKWGAALGGIAGAGLAGRALIAPGPSAELAPVTDLARRLYDELDGGGWSDGIVAYDHPLRQYHNRGVDTGGVWSVLLPYGTRSTLTDLVHASLSPKGRARLPSQQLLSAAGVNTTRTLFAGHPDEDYQVLVTGPHVNLRIGGQNREGVAFGGPQVYGDQRGDGEIGLPGNVYRFQLERGQKLLRGLSAAERAVVRQATAPPQTQVGVRGSGARLPGLAVGALPAAQRARARDFVDSILETYREDDAVYAWRCLENNGGLDALHVTDYEQDYQGGRLAGAAPSQVIRLEGPSAVFHYRGEPHLHAFLNVAMDGEAPLSVGDELGVNPQELEGADVAQFFDVVLRSQDGVDFGFYPQEAVADRLRAGVIRTGDIYDLESWREQMAVVEIQGADLSGEARATLRRQGRLGDRARYRVATIGHAAGDPERFGMANVGDTAWRDSLRDATIAYLRRNDFPEPA